MKNDNKIYVSQTRTSRNMQENAVRPYKGAGSSYQLAQKLSVKGLKYWRNSNLDEYKYILLLPGTDEVVNTHIKAAFESMLCGDNGISICGEAARQLTALYSLYKFSDNVLIGSFDEPAGCKLRNLLNSGVATEDVLISDVILGAMDGSNT